MEATTLSLIEAVDRERIKRRMSDRKFSIEVLGISPSYLCRLKNGERAITLEVLWIFMQKLPEITPEVTYYIMRQGNDGGGGENQGEKTPGGQNPGEFQKTSKKEGDKITPSYLGHGKTKIPPKEPSKNATRG